MKNKFKGFFYDEFPFDLGDIRVELFLRSSLYSFIKKKDIANKNILDIGCGFAYLGNYLLSNKISCYYTGIDKSKVTVDRLSSSGLNIIWGDFNSIQFKDNISDITVSEAFIEHTKEPYNSLFNLVRITKNNSILYLNLYAKYSAYHFLFRSLFFPRFLFLNIGCFKRSVIIFLKALSKILKDRISSEGFISLFADQFFNPCTRFFQKKEILSYMRTHELLEFKRLNKRKSMVFIYGIRKDTD